RHKGEIGSGADGWQEFYDNIHKGRALHDSLCALAAKGVRSGTNGGAIVNQLRALMEGSTAPHDERWKARFAEIPRHVTTAEAMLERERETQEQARRQREAEAAPPCTIDQTLEIFDSWLSLRDRTPIYTVLGTIAANLLPGDPVWADAEV